MASNQEDTSTDETSVTVQQPMRGKHVTIELCKGLFIKTPGVSGGAEAVVIPVGPVIHNAGPALEDMSLHLLIDRPSATFAMDVRAQKGYNGANFEAFAATLLGGATGTSGYTISSAYATRTDFGKHMRFDLLVTDNAVSDQAMVSAQLVLRFAT